MLRVQRAKKDSTNEDGELEIYADPKLNQSLQTSS
jgi:hypothetical protein